MSPAVTGCGYVWEWDRTVESNLGHEDWFLACGVAVLETMASQKIQSSLRCANLVEESSGEWLGYRLFCGSSLV